MHRKKKWCFRVEVVSSAIDVKQKNLLVLGGRSSFYNIHLQVDKILLENNSINN